MSNYLYTLDNKILQHKGLTVDLVGENPVWNGLLSYWRLDETSGTAVADSKGTNTLTNSGCAIVTGKNKNGLQLDTNTDKIEGSNTMFNFERTDSWTFSMWVKRVTTTSGNYGLIGKHKTAAPYTGYAMIFYTTGKLYVEMYASAGNDFYLITTDSFTDTTAWHNIVWTYNGNSNSSGNVIYYDGVSKTFTGYDNTLTNTIKNTEPFIIGRFNATTSLQGLIDEVAVWNRVLTQDEVTLLYNSGNGLFY